MVNFTRGPSPALVVSVVALSFALAGAAFAGTEVLDRALTRGKVKRIARTQAERVVERVVPASSVAHATTATSADTAGNGAAAYGSITPGGFVRPGGHNLNNLAIGDQPYIYCEDQAFNTVVASPGLTADGFESHVVAFSRAQLIDPENELQNLGCPAATEWVYATTRFGGQFTFEPANFQIVAF